MSAVGNNRRKLTVRRFAFAVAAYCLTMASVGAFTSTSAHRGGLVGSAFADGEGGSGFCERRNVPRSFSNRRETHSSWRRPTTTTASSRRSSSLSMKVAIDPPPYPVRVAVLGGGNFGLALASVLGNKGIPVTLLVRGDEVASELNANHRHPRYMPDIPLPTSIRATSDPATALSDATYVVHAVPCQYSREFLMGIREHVPPGVPVVSGSKGIETTSLGFMADILRDCLGDNRSYAFLSGPSFAHEICQGVATAVVIASEDALLADDLADLFSTENFRVFTSKDVMGVEIGGAVKNVIALAAGMCEGLGLGTNAMSGLVTRGCAEMRRLGLVLGARPSTLAGLSGVGDTFGTCFGPLSRNRKFGYRLGKGENVDEILASTTEVAEGVETSKALVKMIREKCKGEYRLDLKYPILFGVADILEGRITPLGGLKGLMNMPLRAESFETRY